MQWNVMCLLQCFGGIKSLTLVGNRHVSALEICVLTGGEEWSEDSGDVMWDLAHYITGDQKRLWAKVSGCCVL